MTRSPPRLSSPYSLLALSLFSLLLCFFNNLVASIITRPFLPASTFCRLYCSGDLPVGRIIPGPLADLEESSQPPTHFFPAQPAGRPHRLPVWPASALAFLFLLRSPYPSCHYWTRVDSRAVHPQLTSSFLHHTATSHRVVRVHQAHHQAITITCRDSSIGHSSTAH